MAQQAKKQQDRGQQALAMVLGTGPTPQAMGEGPSSFTCATSTDCVGISQTGTGRALKASATSSTEAVLVQQSGTGYGLRATAASGAVYGVSTATTGTVFAVRGESASTTGRGILGYATATTGATIGLYGSSLSTTGTGLYGEAPSTTGSSYGIRAKTFSTSGTAIYALALATSGTTKGLWAQVQSAGGTAAVFQNTASGKLFSGVVGTGTGTEVFSVAGNGNLVSAGTLSGTRLISTVGSGTAPLAVTSATLVPNLNADLLDGVHAGAFQSGLAGETSARAAADTTLQNNLNTESTTRATADTNEATLRASADTTLQTNLTTEASTRAARDSALSVRGVTYLAGCNNCFPLLDSDDEKKFYVNVVGNMTIPEVRCFSDAGSPVINLERDDGSPANLLASNLTCTPTGSSSTVFTSGEEVLHANEALNFVMVSAGGVARRVTVVVRAALN